MHGDYYGEDIAGLDLLKQLAYGIIGTNQAQQRPVIANEETKGVCAAIVIFVLRPTEAAVLHASGATSFGINRFNSLELVVRVGGCDDRVRAPLVSGTQSAGPVAPDAAKDCELSGKT